MSDFCPGIFKKMFPAIYTENGLADAGSDYEISTVSGIAFDRLIERDAGDIDSTQLVKSIEYFLNDVNAKIITKTPGKYTGEMRKVIQALMSQGHKIAYDYYYNLCHGIYTAADDSKWVIEVSESNGVWAFPLPIRDTMNTDHTWLGYSPIWGAIDFNDGIELAAASALSDFYDKNPTFAACGWAFNSTGSEAQNTCTTGGGIAGGGTQGVGYLYKIAITETSNAPSSAVMTLEESDDFTIHPNYSMKFPDNNDEYLQRPRFDAGSAETFSAPRYVFYDGDTAIIVRSVGYPSGDTNDLYPLHSVCHLESSGLYKSIILPTRKTCLGTTYRTTSISGTYDRQGTVVGDTALPSSSSLNYGSGGNTIHTGSTVLTPPSETIVLLASTNVVAYDIVSYVTGYAKVYPPSTAADGGQFAVVIPVGDRESVYQFKRTKDAGHEYQVGDIGGYAPYNYGATSPRAWGCNDVSSEVHNSNYANRIEWNDGLSDPTVYFNTYGGTPGDIGTEFCTGQGINAEWHNTSTTQASETNESTLTLIASGGINEQVFSASTDLTADNSYTNEPDPENPQYMYAYLDSSKTSTFFCSDEMNGIDGTKYFIGGVDEITYDVSTLGSAINRFWVGEP